MDRPSEEIESIESFQSKDESSKVIVCNIEVSNFNNDKKMSYTDTLHTKKQ